MFVWAQEQEVELRQKQELAGRERGPASQSKLLDTLQSSLFNDFC